MVKQHILSVNFPHQNQCIRIEQTIMIYMAVDLKVLVRSCNCESRACYVDSLETVHLMLRLKQSCWVMLIHLTQTDAGVPLQGCILHPHSGQCCHDVWCFRATDARDGREGQACRRVGGSKKGLDGFSLQAMEIPLKFPSIPLKIPKVVVAWKSTTACRSST